MGFNPRPPCGERLIGASTNWGESDVSIHALLAESDALTLARLSLSPSFNPRPPCGERPIFCVDGVFFQQFQSTPSLRRATYVLMMVLEPTTVSIHALLAESDSQRAIPARAGNGFNPRPPCGERPPGQFANDCRPQFQSTPSLRRATVYNKLAVKYFNVSIHALLAESDPHVGLCGAIPFRFNPRPPCGERPPHLKIDKVFA